MKRVFAPGCGLKLYNDEAAEKILKLLMDKGIVEAEHNICCEFDPKLEPGSQVINVCPGCDKRFSELHDGITTITLWEVLAERDDFPLPDYKGATMSVHDACPTRKKTSVHQAVRVLLEKMNINVVEAERSGVNSFCCGDSLYKKVSNEKMFEFMKRRADSMPCEDVVVYCTSCTRSFTNGGKQPHYMLDLILGIDTVVEDADPDRWYEQSEQYIREHQG